MRVTFDQKFYKRLSKIKDKELLNRIRKAILNAEAATTVHEILHFKKLESSGDYYRIWIGDYRIGIELTGDTLCFITIAHRNDIYKLFP
jgi:mRNA interferase RelE/StbE